MRVSDYGDRAVLIDTDAVSAVHQALLSAGEPAITAVVPGARSVLVEFTGPRPDLSRILTNADLTATPTGVGEPLVIPVRYDGPDLVEVAELTGLSPEAVIRSHADRDYTVQFCGFSPGFGYLHGLDPRLRLPRLSSPRTVVPAGSVAIADEFTGVYPRSSPGGWRLLGRTDLVLFDLDRDPPALFTPGRRVRFVRQ